MDMDFGYNQNGNGNSTDSESKNETQDSATNITTGKEENSEGGESRTNLDEDTKTESNNEVKESVSNEQQTSNFEKGTTIDADGQTYTIDENGNLLDANGNIFKEASEVQSWIDSFENVTNNDPNGISIQDLQEAIGIDITGEDNQPVQFDNTIEGVKAYVDAVIETAKEEHYDTAINTLYDRYPIIKDVLNYYIANGNSLNGYGEMPDRSGIVVDDSNEAQQEAIIRTAWEEQGRRGDVEGYINYLKSSGTLFTTAQEELAALQEADEQYRQELEEEAERIENERIEQLTDYWNNVANVINNRQIAGYQIPDNIIINRGGQKISVTPNDFYEYLYRVDDNGQSMYARDLAQETPEQRMEDEILRAYLKFTGGNYSNLIDMEINKQKVANLKLRAKERSASSIRINKPKVEVPKGTNIDLGYN